MLTDTTAKPEISKKRADALITWLRQYANERINSRLIDERRCIPPHIILDFGNCGLLGMQVSEIYGGLALSNYDAMRVIEQTAAIDLTLSTFIWLQNSLGIRPIQFYATSSLRNELLPSLAQGRELAAFALTEPGAGSAASSISATALPDGDGGWLLSGTKVWSGSSAWASVINIFVKLLDTNRQPLGVVGFSLRQGCPGLRTGNEALTMGLRGMVQNTIHLDNVSVNSANLLGEPGNGMIVAKDAMLFTRLVISAMSIGGMKRCAQIIHRYATRRSIATGQLLDNPLILAQLSDLTVAITATEALVSMTARLLDLGYNVPEDVFIACKTSGPEFLWWAADTLVQVLGGRGYIETNIAPQILRDSRILRIFEGPSETLKMHLGSRLINQNEELHQFLRDLEAVNISAILKEAALQIQTRCLGANAPFSERPTALRWAYILIGEVTTYAILWAATQKTYASNPSKNLYRAMHWSQLQFEEKLNKALNGLTTEFVMLKKQEITETILNYSELIGDIEQKQGGEEHCLDPLLAVKLTSPA